MTKDLKIICTPGLDRWLRTHREHPSLFIMMKMEGAEAPRGEFVRYRRLIVDGDKIGVQISFSGHTYESLVTIDHNTKNGDEIGVLDLVTRPTFKDYKLSPDCDSAYEPPDINDDAAT